MKTISFLALVAPASAALKFKGWNPSGKLSECEGDCDKDGHCRNGLKCFHRNGYESVPNCPASFWSSHNRGSADFCYRPTTKYPTAYPTRFPTAYPTGKPTYSKADQAKIKAMAQDYTYLKGFGLTPIGSTLGKCVGDCDHNGHCKGGMLCFQRGVENVKVPGCSGAGYSTWDYCYKPSDMANDEKVLTNYGITPTGSILGKCVGDCDKNGDCRNGLKCFQRNRNEKVPGCGGTGGVTTWDYCYDPKDMSIDQTTLTDYGVTPQSYALGKCTGDCDNNGHCKAGLVCHHRNGYETIPGCTGTGVAAFDYCVEPTDSPTKSPTKKPTDSPTASPTESPTKNPTASPTLSPTERCDSNNCMNWSCLDWCECYDDSEEAKSVYESHPECQDDNDDTCICFDKEEHDLNGERHRKINYNQDAVDAGTAKKIAGTEIHTATKQNHYQEAGAKAALGVHAIKISAVAEGKGYNKAVTLTNVGCKAVNLDEYTILLWSNTAKHGGAAFRANPTGRKYTTRIPSGTTLASGASYTICHSKNKYEAQCDQLSNTINHNGSQEDFLQLKHSNELVDSVWDPVAEKDKTCHRTEASLSQTFFESKPNCEPKDTFPVNQLSPISC